MKAARILVLGVAVVAGLGAAYLMLGTKEPPPAPVTIVAPPPVATDDVLLTARTLGPGSVISDGDLRWQSWPKAQVPQGSVQRSLQPNALQELKGMVVRTEMLAGEPLRRERLAKDAGFMSAVLPTGTRAVAIDLADQGKSAAGGFILPNDRVDVIRTFHPDDAPGAFASETLLTNVRVLAIGQAVQDKAGERTVIGGTATLELTPRPGGEGRPRPAHGTADLDVAQRLGRRQDGPAVRAATDDDDHPLRQFQPVAGALMRRPLTDRGKDT